ncbi:hypothetical protein ACVNP0_16030 [Staphylococcus aureus]
MLCGVKVTSLETIIKAVENLEPVEGRLEVLDPSLPIYLTTIMHIQLMV